MSDGVERCLKTTKRYHASLSINAIMAQPVPQWNHDDAPACVKRFWQCLGYLNFSDKQDDEKKRLCRGMQMLKQVSVGTEGFPCSGS